LDITKKCSKNSKTKVVGGGRHDQRGNDPEEYGIKILKNIK